MSLVVVGTDTEVGKTVVSAVVVARYARSHRIGWWKPVATGRDAGPTDRERVDRWCGDVADVLPETYLYGPPVSPHLAARRARRPVDPERILGDLVAHGLADTERHLVIEGIGGVLVPLTDRGYLWTDLLRAMCLPCLVVARSGLGTINHTLLTLQALRAAGVEVAGVVLNGAPDRDNRDAVARFGRVDVVDEVARMPRAGRRGVLEAARRFDRRGLLKEYFS